MMWQVFYGTGDDDPVYYLHECDDREEAEWFAEDKYWDLHKCFGAYAVAVNSREMKATIWGDFIPFAGEFDADFRDEPEFFGPQKPMRIFTFDDVATTAPRWAGAIGAACGDGALYKRFVRGE